MDAVKKSTDDTQLSVGTLRDAQIKWLTDVEAKATEAGTNVPADQQLMLAKLKQQQTDFNTEHVTQWSTLYSSIDGTIKSFASSAISDLFDGKVSFKQKGLDALKAIGDAVLTSFITPFTDAIATFISGAITNLLSGKGLGGVLSSITDIGKGISGIFSSAGTGTGGFVGPIQAGGATPSAGGGAGAAIGAGLSGTVGAVSGVIGAITGIIGLFQNGVMEDKMAAVEKNTRITYTYLGGSNSDNGIMLILWRALDALLFGDGVKAIQEIREVSHAMLN